MPASTTLTPDAILTATEEVLRRHGPAKATVVDVARVLGVSHTAVYRHFPTKQALREAVTRRWLDPSRDTLDAIATDGRIEPAERLHAWLAAVLTTKQTKAREDPELFAAYAVLAAEHSDIAERHVADLLAQLETIIAAGTADGSMRTDDPATTARAVFDATTPFHDLAHVEQWRSPDIAARLDAVCALLLEGLRAATSPPVSPSGA